MRTRRRLIAVVTVALLVAGTNLAAGSAAPKKPIAENVIVMISDGRGFEHDTAVSYYQYGKDARQVYAHFPTSLAMSTYMGYYEGDACYDVGYDPARGFSEGGVPVFVQAIRGELIPWALGTGDPVRDRVEARPRGVSE